MADYLVRPALEETYLNVVTVDRAPSTSPVQPRLEYTCSVMHGNIGGLIANSSTRLILPAESSMGS